MLTHVVPTPNARWKNHRRSLKRPHGFEPMVVEGRLPDDLHGTCYRTGPGLFERFGTRVEHPFEADGVIDAVRFHGGSASAAVRAVESDGWQEEERAGRFLYTSNAGLPSRLRNGFTGRAKNTGNTAVWHWQDRLYTLVESNLPLEIDPRDLSTCGESTLGGVLHSTFSAHPHRVAERKATYNFATRYGLHTDIELLELPDVGRARKIGSFAISGHTMVHDFCATTRHAVFVIGPVRLRLARILLQRPPFEDWFAWEPFRGSEIVVVDLNNPRRVRRFACDAFWCWHVANGFEQDGEIHLDLARYDDLRSLRELGDGTPMEAPKLSRLRINLRAGTVHLAPLVDVACEFPRVHPNYEGTSNRYIWAVSDAAEGRESIVRVDLKTGRSAAWTAPEGAYVTEPILAPRASGREDDCWVLTRCYDHKADRHWIAVLDGANPDAEPVAKVWHDTALPTPFHGVWVQA